MPSEDDLTDESRVYIFGGVKKNVLLVTAFLPLIFASCGGTTDLTVSPPVGTSYSQQQTERLYGTWNFTYTLDTTYTDGYRLSTLNASTVTPGDYFLSGRNDVGGSVIAGYDSKYSTFSLYDPGTTYDQFYIFDFTGQNTVSGCYYLIELSTNRMTDCFAMNGTRSSLNTASLAARSPSELQQKRLKMLALPSNDGPAYRAYLRLKTELK